MKLLTLFISSALTFSVVGAPGSTHSSISQDTVKVQVVDYSGKPPFKREVMQLSVTDVAKLEEVRDGSPVEYAEVRTVVMRGKPPYRRMVETLPVYDVAQLEVLDSSKSIKAGKPPFKRH